MVSKNVQNGETGRLLFQCLPQVAPRWSRDVILELPRALLRPFCRHLEVLGSHFGSTSGPLGCPDGPQYVILEIARVLWRLFRRHFWIHDVILDPPEPF